MNPTKFPLTSDQLELLLAFEDAKGLGHLAERMSRDPSVVSRNLQRLAEDHPVLKKVKGRWEITPLGLQINSRTRNYLRELSPLLSHTSSKKDQIASSFTLTSTLIVINAQVGLLDATLEGRNNSDAEKNISRLLKHWRQHKRPVVHVRHVSDNPTSVFFRQSAGSGFLEGLSPQDGETVIEKTKSSAFSGTRLESVLNTQNASDLVIAGFTANECIDATARDAAALGMTTRVVGDGTATFDMRDPSGRLVKAERIHKLTLLNIHTFYAKVLSTDDVLEMG